LLTLDYAAGRQEDSAHVRTWEVPGAPHIGGATGHDGAIAAGVRARDTGAVAPPDNPVCRTNPFPAWPVADAAWDHLRTWIDGGDPPPAAPRIQLVSTPSQAPPPPGFPNSLIARDDLGNALGGIRTPAIDAPVGTYYGASSCNPGRLGYLAGLFVPSDVATQAKLYPSHDAYVAAVTTSRQRRGECWLHAPGGRKTVDRRGHRQHDRIPGRRGQPVEHDVRRLAASRTVPFDWYGLITDVHFAATDQFGTDPRPHMLLDLEVPHGGVSTITGRVRDPAQATRGSLADLTPPATSVLQLCKAAGYRALRLTQRTPERGARHLQSVVAPISPDVLM
jgi:hypothetical protein